ncbi:MAG: hypothetical protein KDB53_04760, partial [Planctomycetes bacterium]|nr:hypothetical protein [Planctomycetota bacterium]
GYIAGEILSSNGDPSPGAAAFGNLNLDPLFENAALGDLRLGAGSPCLGVADQGVADLIKVDALEASRSADHALSGIVLPDMGAYERKTWSLEVTGLATMGGVQTYNLVGPSTGLGAVLLGVSEFPFYYVEYGYLLIGAPFQVTVVAYLPPNFPFGAPMPILPALDGFPFTVQGIVVSAFNTTRGNFTERFRTRLVL